MRSSPRLLMLSAIMAAVTLMPAEGVRAQMNNKPYAFKNSPGGLGMSNSGRQAIINQEILDRTPDDLLRGPDGFLLDVIKGPGSVVIVRREDNGSFIPGYRGSDFRGGNTGMQVGVFNPFFTNAYTGRSFSGYDDYQTAAIIGAWISTVVPGASYEPANPVTSWTIFVYNMD